MHRRCLESRIMASRYLVILCFLSALLFVESRETKIQQPFHNLFPVTPDSLVPPEPDLRDADAEGNEEPHDDPIVFGALAPHLNSSTELPSNDSTINGTDALTNITDSKDSPRYCTSDYDCIRGSDCDSRLRICVYSIPIIKGERLPNPSIPNKSYIAFLTRHIVFKFNARVHPAGTYGIWPFDGWSKCTDQRNEHFGTCRRSHCSPNPVTLT